MHVQPNALALKAIQYIVLYCLTPPQFHRYSSCNLCPPLPAQDGNIRGFEPDEHLAGSEGISLVNSPADSLTGNWPLTTSHWPLLLQGLPVAYTEAASDSRVQVVLRPHRPQASR